MFCCGGKCWCSYRDPIAYLAVPMAWAQILFVTYCMTFQMVIPVVENKLSVALILISFFVFFILIVWSYVRSMFSDPGIVDKSILKRISEVDPKASTYRRCKKCDDLKPYRSHHCRRCQGCIMKMDHHCPWISNCVGMRNQKYFMLYLLYVAIDEALAFIMTIVFVKARMAKFEMYWHMIPLYYMFDWVRNRPKWALFFEKWYIRFPFFENELMMEVVVCIQGLFSLIFFIFCIILFYDQLKNIWYDKTYIEQAQEDAGDGSRWETSFYKAACEAMGEPFCLRWFLPVEGKDMEREFCECCHLMIPEEPEEAEEHEKVE